MYVWRVPLSSIHTVGLKHLGDDHPEARAVYYESEVYNKRKIKDLLSALRGLRVRSHCAAPPLPPHLVTHHNVVSTASFSTP